MKKSFALVSIALIMALTCLSQVNIDPSTTGSGLPDPIIWELWPGQAPGGPVELPPEVDKTTPEDDLVGGQRVIRLTNVSVPTLSIYKPDSAIDTGTAIVVAPGGGHWILAMDLEGTEIVEWLNSLGITAILLKYRVPGNAWYPKERWKASAQDGQRAISLVRARAAEIGLDPHKIGILGFSAGGSPVRYTSLTTTRLYEPVDAYDEITFCPDFAAPIYSGGIPLGYDPDRDLPPFFMVTAHDDQNPVQLAEMYLALKKAGALAELHIYQSGGHGYGIRDTGHPVNDWPDRMEEWMRKLGFLDPVVKLCRADECP